MKNSFFNPVFLDVEKKMFLRNREKLFAELFDPILFLWNIFASFLLPFQFLSRASVQYIKLLKIAMPVKQASLSATLYFLASIELFLLRWSFRLWFHVKWNYIFILFSNYFCSTITQVLSLENEEILYGRYFTTLAPHNLPLVQNVSCQALSWKRHTQSKRR